MAFEVLPGEIHTLMGENGAGKSTLIKLLTGIYQQDSGEVRLAGQLINPRSPKGAEALGLATVFQEIILIAELSVAANLLLGRQPRRFGLIDFGGVQKRAQEVLGRFNLELDVNRSVSSLPPALQQMVQLARALAVDAKLLILDEPTSSLDKGEAARLFAVIRRLREEGMGLVFVTHFLDQVYEICDRVTVLRNGELVACKRFGELPRLKLTEAMLGRPTDKTEKRALTAARKTSTAVLSAKGLARPRVVGPISFELGSGEVLGLAGLLGSGRSETARMLPSAEPAELVKLKIDERPTPIKAIKAIKAINAELAFSAEERKREVMIPNLSVQGNISLALQASRGAIRLQPREHEWLSNHYIRALNVKTPSAETPVRLLMLQQPITHFYGEKQSGNAS